MLLLPKVVLVVSIVLPPPELMQRFPCTNIPYKFPAEPQTFKINSLITNESIILDNIKNDAR